jgi:hypothetical protein
MSPSEEVVAQERLRGGLQRGDPLGGLRGRVVGVELRLRRTEPPVQLRHEPGRAGVEVGGELGDRRLVLRRVEASSVSRARAAPTARRPRSGW